MDIQTRPKRKKRVLVPDSYDSYTYYLPIDKTERMRRAAAERGQSYSEAMEEAMDLYLALKIHIRDMDNRMSGSTGNGNQGDSR